jgi:hypothetical protein
VTLHAAILVAALASACSSSPAAHPEPDTPSFARDIAPVLSARCAMAGGCHGADPTPAVDLDLRSPAAYDQLVEVRAESGSLPIVRVAAGDPDRSLLVQKLTGALGPGQGKRMPLDPATREPVDAVPAAWVDAVLVRWIEAGAPRD